MRRIVSVAVLLGAAYAAAQSGADRKAVKETVLKKKDTELMPDKSLAGDVTRKKEKREEAPSLSYDQFRVGIELQVASKRREQIADLEKIIELSQDKKERPSLLFRLGELFWEESKFFFFEANRKDDDKIRALNADDKAGVARAEAEKQALLEQSKPYAQKAIEQYSRIVQEFKNYERTDEVLYFLGLNLMEMGDERRALVAYQRLIQKFPKSKYIPDAYLAVGEYYFNTSRSRRDMLKKALDNYKSATNFPENAVYGYALYKQGWCYFNMNDFDLAMDQFKTVVLYAEFAGADVVEGPKRAGRANRSGLAKEARNDYVRAYSRAGGGPTEAKERFAKLAKTPDDLRLMMKQLASLFYDDGRNREAAAAYDMLIKERPTSPEAPSFQSRIVDCVMRLGNKEMTVQQVRRLVKLMDDVQKANPTLAEKDKRSLDEARELAERTISNLAVSWHQEAKKTRDDKTFEYADAVYGDYLTLFPDSPKAYDLRFFWALLLSDNLGKYQQAAEEYNKVFAMDIAKLEKGGDAKPGKLMKEAAFNAILAWVEVVKKATAEGKIKLEASADPTKKMAMAPEKKALLEARERYLKYIEKGENRVEIMSHTARMYYDHNDFDPAVKIYSEIALNHPEYKSEDGSRLAEFAANLVLDSFNIQGDWQKVNEWARRFYAEPQLAQGSLKAELFGYIERSSFKLINQLENRKDFAKAAEAYLTFVTEWPKSELAEEALYNAAINFFNAKMLDRAIEVRKQLIRKYPLSKYLPQTVYALAEGYEAIADFAQATEFYEAYATKYAKSRGPEPKKSPRGKRPSKETAGKEAAAGEQHWEESKAQDALFNAAVFREGLGQYKQAIKNREQYLELWPNSKDAEAVEKSTLDLYEKMGNWRKVLDGLVALEKKNARDVNKILVAEGKMASIYESKLKNSKAASGVYERIWDYYEKLPKRLKDSLDAQALDAVGRASFLQNEDDFRKYSAIKLRWSKLQNPGELKGSIKLKGEALANLQKGYTRTVSLKAADAAICALYKIGLAYDEFADQLVHFPVPAGLPEEMLLELKLQFDQQAEQPKTKAQEAFAAVVGKSQELDAFNACSKSALEMLRTKHSLERFPSMPDDVFELKYSVEPLRGAEILTRLDGAEGAGETLPQKAREAGQNVAAKRDSESPASPLAPPAATAAAGAAAPVAAQSVIAPAPRAEEPLGGPKAPKVGPTSRDQKDAKKDTDDDKEPEDAL